MKKQTFHAVLFAMVLAGVIALGVATLTPAVTVDRYSGNYWTYSCVANDDPIASQTDLTTGCAFAAPQTATLEGFQAYCVTETSTAKTFELMEGAAITATLELDTLALPHTAWVVGTGTAEIADEALMLITYTTAAGESATDCSFVVQLRLH